MSINEWIEKLENQRSLSREEYYARLVHAKEAIQSRLDCADSDGIDLDQIEPHDDEY